MLHKTSSLYKVDKKNKIRVYFIEYDTEECWYRINTGILNGKIVSTLKYYPTPKNIGKSNETSYYDQLILEVNAIQEKAIKDGYTLEFPTSSNFSVMLAYDFNKIKNINYSDYYGQPKLDGIRAYFKNKELYSRTNRKIEYSQNHIIESLSIFSEKYPNIILDGELYLHEYRDLFNEIVSNVRKQKSSDVKLKYFLYDFYNLDNPDIPYSDRYLFLCNEFLENEYPNIEVVLSEEIYTSNDLNILNYSNLKNGYEGSILRNANSKYEFGRSKNLLKYKIFNDEEFEIIDIEEGTGNWQGLAKSITVDLGDGLTCKSNIKGSEAEMKDLILNKNLFIGTLATVKFFGRTEDKKLRFPVATKFHLSESRIF